MTLNNLEIRSGVIGGTLLSSVFNISLNDVIFTVVMAVIGAVVSFGVSSLLKWLFTSKTRSKK
jgi:prepilin signal peptidase PulO-like enzyme (type II secretory pathway)